MAISERRRLTFTAIAVILVGIITGLLLGGGSERGQRLGADAVAGVLEHLGMGIDHPAARDQYGTGPGIGCPRRVMGRAT